MKRHGLAALAVLASSALACSGEPLTPTKNGAPSASASASSAPAPPAFRLPDGVTPTKAAATLTLVPQEDTFRGSIDIDVNVAHPTSVIWLHARDLQVSEAHVEVGGAKRAARVVPGGEELVGFVFEEEVPAGPARVSATYTGHVLASDDRGVFRESEGSDVFLFSQFENVEARRAFPCFDEPGVKIPWQLTLRVKTSDTALSNTPVLEEKPDEGGFKTVRFAPTKPLPSYLVAFAVGPFELVDAGVAGKNKTPIRLAVPRGKKAEAAFAATATPKIIDLLEGAFGVPYPYEKLDLVTIPHLASFGAMENAGMITADMIAILAKPGEDTVEQRFETVSLIAHEAAHQWFGDLVTMKWWNDVWLNEGFATWMEGKVTHQYDPTFGRDLGAITWVSNAMRHDGLLSARKVRQEVLSYDDITNAFDGITYTKGGAVLGMFEAWLGRDAFGKGIRVYLDRFAYKNADSSDFLTALGEGSGKDVKAAFSTFLDQPGVPIVTGSLACDGSGATLTLEQERFLPVGSKGSAGASTWRIPVCARYAFGDEVNRTCTLLSDKKATLSLRQLADKGTQKKGVCPDWIMLKDAGVGYYRVAYSPKDVAALLDGKAPLSAAERLSVVADVYALASEAKFPIGDALDKLPGLLKDPSAHVQSMAGAMGFWLNDDFVDEDLRPNARRFIGKVIAPRARALGWQAKPGDSHEVRRLREALLDVMIESGDDPKLFAEAADLTNKWIDNPSAIESDSVETVLRAAASRGDKKLFDRLVALAKTERDARRRDRIMFAVAGFHDPALSKASLELFLDGSIDPRNAMPLFWGQPHVSRAIVWDFIKAKFDAVMARVPAEVRPYIVGMRGDFCDEAHRADVEKFMSERAQKITGAPRALSQALESISLCVARREARKESLRAFLKKQ